MPTHKNAKPNTCIFERASGLCIEHGKKYKGEPECSGARRGRILEKAVSLLQGRRDKMRLFWISK